MDQRFLDYYKQELLHVRERGREFAEENPKIAARLGLDSFEKDALCPDPYVERLLEGFAFLAARVQLKIDAQFPEFTQHMLEFVYPHYLAPTPSMMVVKIQPEPSCSEKGVAVARHTVLKSKLNPVERGEQTRCTYRTAHEVKLWPLEITEAQYESNPAAIPVLNQASAALPGFEAAIRLRLRTTGEFPPQFNQLNLDALPLFLSGSGDLPALLYENLLGNAVGVALSGKKAAQEAKEWHRLIPQKPQRMGFADDQALLPYGPRSFQGYRLLQEYFACPERFLFVALAGLGEAFKGSADHALDVYILLKKAQPKLAGVLNKSFFSMFCTPAINLFPLPRADHIELTGTQSEYQIIPDRTRMADFEVYAVERVTAHGAKGQEKEFLPFYSINAGHLHRVENAYYTIQRRKSLATAKQRRSLKPTGYDGTDAYLSLVDVSQAPYDSNEFRELRLKLWCTNRDLAHKKRSQFTEFSMEIEVKAESVQCVASPTDPKPSHAVASTAWRLLSHLSLNYLSLTDTEKGCETLRELMTLYSDPTDNVARKQIEGLQSVGAKNVVRRIDAIGPIVFGRGIEITVLFEESAFEGGSAFLFGAVLDQFFARYASLNTFTETVIKTDKRGEIMRWPIRTGQRHTL